MKPIVFEPSTNNVNLISAFHGEDEKYFIDCLNKSMKDHDERWKCYPKNLESRYSERNGE